MVYFSEYTDILLLATDIMSKFSARFDTMAAKDAKGKGKANPPSSLSLGGAKSVPGKNPCAIAAKSASTTQGSPLVGKAPAVDGM
jgi:hypothetical protein